jgi:hypothetical protein
LERRRRIAAQSRQIVIHERHCGAFRIVAPQTQTPHSVSRVPLARSIINIGVRITSSRRTKPSIKERYRSLSSAAFPLPVDIRQGSRPTKGRVPAHANTLASALGGGRTSVGPASAQSEKLRHTNYPYAHWLTETFAGIARSWCVSTGAVRTRIIHLINPKTDSVTTRPVYMNRALRRSAQSGAKAQYEPREWE